MKITLNKELGQINLEFTQIASGTQRRVRCLKARYTKWPPSTIM